MTEFGKRPGDMFKSVYDTDDDDTVDDSSKLQGKHTSEVQDHAPKSHTHVEADVTDLDHDALKVKGVIINDAAKADQKVLAYDSGSDRIVYITQAPSGASIESIQYGSISITGTDFTNTATITSVDTTKAVVMFLGSFSAVDDANVVLLSVVLTNATTVTARRRANTGGATSHCKFCVIEFSSGINSVQSGFTAIPEATSHDITVSAVVLAKTLIIYGGVDAVDNTNILYVYLPELELINTTTLRLTKISTKYGMTLSWFLLEFT